MIQANELRIGNYVYDLDRENPYYYTVEQIRSKQYCDSSEEPNDEIIGKIEGSKDGYYDIVPSPIPLTEEWLVRFGFDTFRSINSDPKTFYNDRFDYGIEIYQDGSIWFEKLRLIKHVHQLQNLYFALTGQELKLTEK